MEKKNKLEIQPEGYKIRGRPGLGGFVFGPIYRQVQSFSVVRNKRQKVRLAKNFFRKLTDIFFP
tara:strand:- start:535 stop:726 length:192 start_codon:yes stop_codon:yes gene_type:complete